MAEAVGMDSHIDTIQRVLVMSEDLGKRHDVGHVGHSSPARGRNARALLCFLGPGILPGRGGRAQDPGSPGCHAISLGRA